VIDVTEVHRDVFFVQGRVANWCLVRDQAGVTLIDAAWPKDLPEVVRSLETIGSRPDDVRGIAITHAHRDHMGTSAEFRERHGIDTHCHVDEVELAQGRIHQGAGSKDLLPRIWRPSVFMVAMTAILRGGLRGAPPLESVITFEEGTRLDLPGHPLAIATPGHTSGHAAFHLPEAGVLVSGDALVSHDLRNGHVGPALIDDLYQHDPDQARTSLLHLEAVEASVILPGHGRAIHMTPEKAVERALGRLED
jgi:glyoxylase-like metal-dependent hydrolase (beta-lactamase superfamily II)